MIFLNPLLLLGTLGIALPILAHLLNKHQFKQTDWAAMQFLSRSVKVRSRQVKLRDWLLLVLRCLAILFLVLAISRPLLERAEGGLSKQFGEPRAGVVIALDASFSMQHRDGTRTRFERAVGKAELIARSVEPGDPISLILLGAEHKIVVRNMAYDADRFNDILQAQKASDETLNLESVPGRLKKLVDGMVAGQKEIHLVTDTRQLDWNRGVDRLRNAFLELNKDASLIMVPVQGSSGNLAITNLELVSGVLRKDTTARYRATVKNFGENPATNVTIRGGVNNINVDTKSIPSIAANSSETVSLFIPFQNSGPVQITAKLDADALPLDDERRIVAVIRERVSILCVEGSSGGSGAFKGFISAALLARDSDANQENFEVKSVPWISLPAQDLATFDVVILADVPAITAEQARQLDEHVRAGNGLVWFPGENIKPAIWNKQSSLAGTALLPAVIEQTKDTSNDMGVGRPLEPTIPDHPVCRPLQSLSKDLLSEAQFLKVLQVKPVVGSTTVLALAGSASPLLIEHALGRGQVFMFTSSAQPTWNNMALTPIFPMLLQQMVTYLTSREFEKPRLVGNSLSLSYEDQPDASNAVFDTPAGETITVPVRKHRNQFVALLDRANEAGFYLARVSVQAPGMPIAVNVDTGESEVKCLPADELSQRFRDTEIMIARSKAELLDSIQQARAKRSFWHFFLIAGLVCLVLESLLAHFTSNHPDKNRRQKNEPATAMVPSVENRK